MNIEYDLIIWDVDGTLLDTSEGIISAARYAIEDAGFKVPDDEALKNYIGPPIQETFAREFKIQMDKALKMAGVFRSHYKDYDLMKAKRYDGILELVAEINNLVIKQGIATNKREDYAGEIIRLFGFSKYVEIVHGSDFEGKLTKKDIIQNVIRGCHGTPLFLFMKFIFGIFVDYLEHSLCSIGIELSSGVTL